MALAKITDKSESDTAERRINHVTELRTKISEAVCAICGSVTVESETIDGNGNCYIKVTRPDAAYPPSDSRLDMPVAASVVSIRISPVYGGGYSPRFKGRFSCKVSGDGWRCGLRPVTYQEGKGGGYNYVKIAERVLALLDSEDQTRQSIRERAARENTRRKAMEQIKEHFGNRPMGFYISEARHSQTNLTLTLTGSPEEIIEKLQQLNRGA